MEKTIITYPELVDKLNAIKELGFVKTHRTGQTGIGKTLEDLLGIEENNIPGPNAAMLELKSERKNVSSMITLFTKNPKPQGANSRLYKRYGYLTPMGKQLHTTVSAQSFNQLRGKPGFKINVKEDRIELVNIKKEILGYWDKKTLKNSFETKIPKLLFVKAETRGEDADEEFWYNEAWLLSGFGFEHFVETLTEGIILVDTRIGLYPDGTKHDHGTGFRILPDKLDLCFQYRKRIV